MKAQLLSKVSDHQCSCHTTSLSLRMFHKPSTIPQTRLRSVPFTFYRQMELRASEICSLRNVSLSHIYLLSQYGHHPSAFRAELLSLLQAIQKGKKQNILCRLRLNKSESLFLLLIMKMNRHLLHGACTSQNKISNINNTPLLVLITHNNLQAKSPNHIKKKK